MTRNKGYSNARKGSTGITGLVTPCLKIQSSSQKINLSPAPPDSSKVIRNVLNAQILVRLARIKTNACLVKKDSNLIMEPARKFVGTVSNLRSNVMTKTKFLETGAQQNAK